MREFSRRSVLLASGLALAGCSSSSPSSRPSALPTSLDTPTPTPSPTHPPSPTPVFPALTSADIDATAAGFANRQPTAWGLDIAGIIQRTDDAGIALTLDACGGPGGSAFDQSLIDFLRERQIPATLFLNSRWIEANLSLAQELASDDLFELGNHGTRHCPLCVTGRDAYCIPGTATAAEATREVADNHLYMAQELGVEPRLFRSGTAHYDDVGIDICRALGEVPIGFSINGDGGATFSPAQVESAVSTAHAGSIIIAHMNQPEGNTAEGMKPGLSRLLDAGFAFTHLPTLPL
ncbi:MAG: polysaccharide deacetylase family protein [Actinomycetaceae bacterium]|nr:polysaccharide deacetylase family protein [Actinomycetaceae bacterium]